MMAFTGTRQSEARGARWDEIDRDEALVVYPRAVEPNRYNPMIVPLSGPVLAVIAEAWERTGGIAVVVPLRHRPAHLPRHPGQTAEKPRSVMCAFVSRLLQDMDGDQDVPDNVAELALGHTQPLRPGQHRTARTTPDGGRTVGRLPRREHRPCPTQSPTPLPRPRRGRGRRQPRLSHPPTHVRALHTTRASPTNPQRPRTA